MAYVHPMDALGDSTRRAIFERLRFGPKPVVELAHGLPVSRPAVSQHLRVLKEAGLVRDQAVGTRRIYEVDPDGFGQVRTWLEDFWTDALDAFKGAAEAEGSKE
jgi:DNA-binding transcriptional ArsR family regulator